MTGRRRLSATRGTKQGTHTLKRTNRVKQVPRNEVQVQIDNDTFQYGHEYVGLNPIFQVPPLKTSGTLKLCSHSKQFSSLAFLSFSKSVKRRVNVWDVHF